MSRTVSQCRRSYNTWLHNGKTLMQEQRNGTHLSDEDQEPRFVDCPSIIAAAQLFASYRGHQRFEAEFISSIFIAATQNLDDFKQIILSNDIINTLFNSAAHDMKGLNPLIAKKPLERIAFQQYVEENQTNPSFPFLKAFLGRCISTCVQANKLTEQNCGFASACLVVIEELSLTNVKKKDRDKIINAANFSTGLFDRASAIEARREQTRVRLDKMIADDLKAATEEIHPRLSMA